jgi:WD40 repeat protein
MNLIACGSPSGVLTYSDPRSGKFLPLIQDIQTATTLNAHKNWISCIKIYNSQVFTTSFDSLVKCWDLRFGATPLYTMSGADDEGVQKVFGIAIDDEIIAYGGESGKLFIFDHNSNGLRLNEE